MRTLILLFLCLNLLAQQAPPSFADQLLRAPDDASVTALLDANAAAITPDLFETCRKAAQTHLDKREHPEALRSFLTLLAVANRLHSDRGVAVSDRGLGISYWRVNQPRPALTSYESGLPAAVRSGDKALQAEVLRGMGVVSRALGLFPQALDADERSVALYRELGDVHQIAAGLTNMGGNYNHMGDLRRAGEIWEEALRTGANYPDVVSTATSNLALVAGQLGNAPAAREYLESTNRYAEGIKDWHALAIGLINVGMVYREQSDYTKTFDTYKRALELVIQTHDIRLQSVIYLNRSSAWLATKRRDLAIADLEECLRLGKDGDAKEIEANALATLSTAWLGEGNPEKALDYAKRAAAVAEEFQAPVVQWQAFETLGKAQLAMKDSANARSSLERAIASVELMRSRSGGSEEDGQNFLNGRIGPYHDLLELDIDEGMPEQALALAERAKARQLLDVLRLGKTQPARSMTAEDTAREQELSDRLSQLDQQLAAATPATRAEIRKRLTTAESEMEGFRVRLYAAHPALAAQRGDAAPLTLPQAAALLPDAHTAIVEFSSGEDQLSLFTITRGPHGDPVLHTHVIHWGREDLTREVDDFAAKLSARDPRFRDAATRFYQRLLSPAAAELADTKLLVIVPDGPLWNLPFQALIARNGHYLIERQAVFYAPSLTWLRESRESKHDAWSGSRQLLALGDPDEAHLPDAAQEVRKLVQLYGAGAKALTGADAAKADWERAAPDYRILHVATHGILNPQNPLYSYLVFSGKTAGDKVLEAREVANLPLHPDLVILSACETGRGRVSLGEGLVGMSWAFLLAGARTTVVSQWKIDSAGTTQLMIDMHAALKPVFASGADFGRARSLQKAALDLMRAPEYRHPFYWAGFVMVGDGY